MISKFEDIMMSTVDNAKCVTVATLTAICEVAFHTVQQTGGNEISLPESRDILEDIANEVKLQLVERANV